MNIVLPANHPLAQREQINLHDLANDVWIVGNPASCCGAVTRSICAASGFSPDIRHHTNDWQAVAGLVDAGLGVALVPRLAGPLQRSGLILREVSGLAPVRNIFGAIRAGAEHNTVVRAVLDQIAASARAYR